VFDTAERSKIKKRLDSLLIVDLIIVFMWSIISVSQFLEIPIYGKSLY